jgi:succinate dehydrogenase flavin-adding protein (antitoxin of CptAB toxin-antitoxin module)
MGRIRWHCRRGLLELDLVLTRFLERDFGALSPDQLEAFKALLEYPDNDLWDLVCGRTEPQSGASAAVVKLLRDG